MTSFIEGQNYLVICYHLCNHYTYYCVEYLDTNRFKYYSNVRNHLPFYNVNYPADFGPLDDNGQLNSRIEFIPSPFPTDILQKITWDM